MGGMSGNSFLKKFCALIVFAVFPLLLIGGTIVLMENLEVEKEIDKERTKQDTTLSRLQRADNEPQRISGLLNHVFMKVRDLPPKEAKKWFDRLRQMFPGSFDLYCFDRFGSLIPELSSKTMRKAAQLCFGCLEYQTISGKFDIQRTGLFENFFGGTWQIFVCLIVFSKRAIFTPKIPLKLIGLFIFAVGIPVYLVLVGGFYALKDHERVMLDNLGKEMEVKLREIDERFKEENHRSLKLFNQTVAEISRNPIKNRETFLRACKPIEKLIGSGTVILVNGEGKATFLTQVSEKSERGNRLLIRLGQTILLRLNPNFARKSSSILSAGVVESVSEIHGSGLIDDTIKNLGKFWAVDLFGDKVFVFATPILDEDGNSEFLFYAKINSKELENRYLSVCETMFKNHPEFSFLLDSYTSSFDDAAFVGWNSGEKARLKSVILELMLKKSVAKKVIRNREDDQIWLGISGKNLAYSYLVAHSSLSPLKLHIDRLWLILLIIAFLEFSSSLFIGRLLSEQFLKPIEGLGMGIKAIRRQDFRFKIPILAPDELGELAGQFNRMIENLGDVNMAKQVQGKLFPGAVMEAGEYRVYGVSQPASDLGGDYFDYLTFGDRKMLILVGDVSGHGIAAALVMAMSKAMVSSFSKSDHSHTRLFETLNQVILDTMKFSALMTMCALLVDTKTNELQLFSFGHPLPYKAEFDGKIRELEGKTSRPLGSMKVFPTLRPNSVTLNSGERMIFYTDGLVESLDEGEEKTGFRVFQEYLQGCPGLTLENACPYILLNHPFLQKGLPQPDDFTVVIVERRTIV